MNTTHNYYVLKINSMIVYGSVYSLIYFSRYKVTVVAKEYASPVASRKCITSEIAGALWEWPPAVCGRHTDEKSLERSKVWCMDSYAKFMELAMKPKDTGGLCHFPKSLK